MEVAQRSYSGHAFRPRPVIEELKSHNALAVATSWGEPDHAQMVIEMIKEQLTVITNPEATRLNSYIADLSEEANHLREAAVMVNEQLFLRENSREYKAAVEILLVSVQKQVLSWVQLGTPHLILANQSGLQPLASFPDWSWQMQQDSPLLTKALGLERSCYPACGSHRLQGQDKLLMLSRSAVPSRLYSLHQVDLKNCSQALVEDHPEAPFWLGLLEL